MIQKIHFGVENLVFKALCSDTFGACLKAVYIILSLANHFHPCTALDVLAALVDSIC